MSRKKLVKRLDYLERRIWERDQQDRYPNIMRIVKYSNGSIYVVFYLRSFFGGYRTSDLAMHRREEFKDICCYQTFMDSGVVK